MMVIGPRLINGFRTRVLKVLLFGLTGCEIMREGWLSCDDHERKIESLRFVKSINQLVY